MGRAPVTPSQTVLEIYRSGFPQLRDSPAPYVAKRDYDVLDRRRKRSPQRRNHPLQAKRLISSVDHHSDSMFPFVDTTLVYLCTLSVCFTRFECGVARSGWGSSLLSVVIALTIDFTDFSQGGRSQSFRCPMSKMEYGSFMREVRNSAHPIVFVR